MSGHARPHCIVNYAKTAEAIDMSFWLRTRVGRSMCYMGSHWRYLANTTEPSVCVGHAALCQIALTTCLFLVPCARLMRLAVSFWAYVKYFVYRIVYRRPICIMMVCGTNTGVLTERLINRDGRLTVYRSIQSGLRLARGSLERFK